MLIPIVAAQETDDSVLTADSSSDIIQSQENVAENVVGVEDQSDDNTISEDDDDLSNSVDVTSTGESSADLEIVSYTTPNKLKVGDDFEMAFVVYNHGPDKAENVVAFAGIIEGDIVWESFINDKGNYDPVTGIWDIGDLENEDSATLIIFGYVVSDTPIVVYSNVTSDTPDADESNNEHFEDVFVEDINDGSVSKDASALHATGNPVLMAILALLAIVGVSLKRKD